MKQMYEYHLKDSENSSFVLKCRAEYDTENSYNTTYYFYDGNEWIKDFIDLDKLSPNNEEENRDFQDFITRVHDFMVHGNLWAELKEMKDKETKTKKAYKISIDAEKVEGF